VSRLQTTLDRLHRDSRKARVTFITAGDPDLESTVPAMLALVRGGADVLELGFPFSDPEAEGPSVQASSERALKAGTRLASVLDMVRVFREHDRHTPVVLMGYLNSIERMGYEAFAARAAEVGADGAIVVNLPPEEARPLLDAFQPRGLDLIFLVAPTTTPPRLKRIADVASGFIYYVSLKGVTGASHLDPSSVAERVAAIRRASSLPVMVGFGIKDAETAARISKVADGVVLGSAIVDTMSGLAQATDRIPDALERQARALREALDRR